MLDTLDSEAVKTRKKPYSLVKLFFRLVGIGVLAGGTTNMINGKVSEHYFSLVMGWDFEGIWIAAILQGVFEGLIYGFVFGTIFVIGFAPITQKEAEWSFVKRLLSKILLIIYVCWLLGGITGLLFNHFFPGICGLVTCDSPYNIRAGIAWVGYSIWGGILGGMVALLWGLINTHLKWQELKM